MIPAKSTTTTTTKTISATNLLKRDYDKLQDINADEQETGQQEPTTDDSKMRKRRRKKRKRKQKPKTTKDKVGRLIRVYAIKTVRQEMQQQYPMWTQILAQRMSERLKTRHKQRKTRTKQ